MKNGIPMLFTYFKEDQYLIPFYDNYVDIKTFKIHGDTIVFNDLYHFDNEEWMTNLVEPCITYVNNEITVLFRNYKEPGVFQSKSYDDGSTFSNPLKTNIIEDNRISLPLSIYDNYTKKYWFIAGDRRYENKSNSKLWIYSNDSDSEKNYHIEYIIDRPLPNNWQFYGYPAITLMKNGKYLVIFTDSYWENDSEEADFYQFTLTPIKSNPLKN